MSGVEIIYSMQIYLFGKWKNPLALFLRVNSLNTKQNKREGKQTLKMNLRDKNRKQKITNGKIELLNQSLINDKYSELLKVVSIWIVFLV